MIIAIARGGVYSEGAPAAALEHLETYLRGVFNFIGIEPEFVIAEGLNISAEQRESRVAIGEPGARAETVRLPLPAADRAVALSSLHGRRGSIHEAPWRCVDQAKGEI